MRLLRTMPSQSALAAVTLTALVAAVLIWLQLAGPEQIMQQRGYGIVSYELAFTPGQAGAILTAWGEEGRAAARRSLEIDFAFIPAYSLFFGGLTLLAARTQQGRRGAVGLWLVPGILLAALLDTLENILLLALLETVEKVPSLPPLIAGMAASLKFVLLFAAVIYWTWIAAGMIRDSALLRRRPH